MSARLGAQSIAVWTNASAVVLLDGIEATERGKGLAELRLRSLHPLPEGKNHYSTDFEKRLRKIFEKQSADYGQPWLTSVFWQQEVDSVLTQGIFGRSASKASAVDRIHSVWPGLSATWLYDRMEEIARAGLPNWIQSEFWAVEIDPILRVGLERAHRFRREAVDAVLKAYPTLQVGAIWVRLGELRNRRNREAGASSETKSKGPAGVDSETDSAAGGTSNRCYAPNGLWVWTARADAILLDCVRQANRCEREAVDKVLGAFSELRVCAIWARLRRLRYQRTANHPVAWTNELDARLVLTCREAGLSASVSDIQNLTDWPRRAILRRAHKLGLPTEAVNDRRRWTMAEFRFAIESVNHVSVRDIADDLERSEKAVWDMLTRRGISARFEDGYSVREISTKLHIRRPSIRMWVKSGELHKKRNGRIAEDSLQSFLYNHPESINWRLLDEDGSFWVAELIEAEKIKVNGAGTRSRANSRNAEESREAVLSTPDDSASNAPEADPSADLVLHNNRARGASSQR
jgi:hypothetical protein